MIIDDKTAIATLDGMKAKSNEIKKYVKNKPAPILNTKSSAVKVETILFLKKNIVFLLSNFYTHQPIFLFIVSQIDKIFNLFTQKIFARRILIISAPKNLHKRKNILS
jgi:hypothetical protein